MQQIPQTEEEYFKGKFTNTNFSVLKLSENNPFRFFDKSLNAMVTDMDKARQAMEIEYYGVPKRDLTDLDLFYQACPEWMGESTYRAIIRNVQNQISALQKIGYGGYKCDSLKDFRRLGCDQISFSEKDCPIIVTKLTKKAWPVLLSIKEDEA